MTKAGKKRLKFALYTALVFALFVLQTTRGVRITVFSVSPDYLVMLIPALALFEGPYAAASLGFIAGIFLSTSGPNIEGLEALWLAMLGLLTGHFGALYMRRVLPSSLLIGSLSILLRGLISYVLYYGLAYGAAFWRVLLLTAGRALLSLPFGALLFELVRRISLRFGEEER